MQRTVAGFPLERLYIWASLMGIIGMSVVLSSVMSLVSGSGNVGDWLMLVGGGSMLLGAGYEAIMRDPDEFSMNGYWIGILVFAAVLTVLGAALNVASSF